MKTASEMTYTVSGGALKLYSNQIRTKVGTSEPPCVSAIRRERRDFAASLLREQQVCTFGYLRTLTTWHCPHSPAAAAAIHRYLLPAGPTAANLRFAISRRGAYVHRMTATLFRSYQFQLIFASNSYSEKYLSL